MFAVPQQNAVNTNPDFIDLSNPINWDHPLAQHLKHLWLAIPQYNGGLTFIDLCDPASYGTLTNMDGSEWVQLSENGQFAGLQFNGTTEYVDFSSANDVPTTSTESFTCAYIARKTDSSSGTKLLNAAGGVTNGYSAGLGWTNLAGRGFAIAVPTYGGVSITQKQIHVAGTPHTTFDNNWHFIGFNYPGGVDLNVDATVIRWVIDGVTYTSESGVGFGASGDFYRIGGRGTTTGWPGIIACHAVWIPAIGPELLAKFEVEAESGYLNLLNRIPSLLPVSVSEAAGGSYSLTVDSQSIAVTGTDASLLYDRILSVDSGSFTLTGTAVTLNKGFTLVVDSQAITVTGTDAGVFYNRSLSIDSQSITVTGTNAGTLFNRNLSVDSQAITVAGTNASTFYNRSLSADGGSVTLSGTASTLTVSGVGNYSITADGKVIALSPTDASLLFNRQISVDAIEITITGTDASVFHNRVINSDSGTVTLAGQDSSLLADRILSADSDSLAITGTDAGTFYNRSLSANGGSFTVSASDVSLLYDRILSVGSQAVTVVGTVATLQYSEDIGVYVYVASIAIAKIGSASIGLSNSHDVSITVD